MKLSHIFILLVVVFAVFTPDLFAADDGKTAASIVDQVLNAFKDAGGKWLPVFKEFGQRLFYLLAVISLVWTIVPIMLSGGGHDLGELFAPIIRWTIVTGLFYAILQNGAECSNDILTTFIGPKGLAPKLVSTIPAAPNSTGIAGILKSAMSVPSACAVALFAQNVDAITAFGALIMSIGAAVFIIMIAGRAALALIAAYLFTYAGQIILGFGGSQWTRDMTVSYLKGIVGVGLQVLTVYLIVQVVNSEVSALNQTIEAAASSKVKVSIYGDVLVILIVSIIGYFMADTVPTMIAGLVGGPGSFGGAGLLTFAAVTGAYHQLASSMAGSGQGGGNKSGDKDDGKESGKDDKGGTPPPSPKSDSNPGSGGQGGQGGQGGSDPGTGGGSDFGGE